MNKYNFEYIDNLRIHELRDFARKLGVPSPTTKKKEELISKINSIIKQENLTENDSNFISKERDMDFFDLLSYDNYGMLNNLLNINKDNKSDLKNKPKLHENVESMIIKKSYNDDTPYLKYNDDIKFSFSLNQNETKYTNDDSVYIEGFIDIHPDGYGIVRANGFVPNDNDSYVSSYMVKKNHLRKGQFISCKYRTIMDGKFKVVYDILEIDGHRSNKILTNFEEFDNNGIGSEYYLSKFNFAASKGERHYINNMSLKDSIDLGFDFVDENSTSVILVNIKARPEDNFKSHQKFQIVNVPFNKSEIEVVNSIDLVIEKIKRDFEHGKQNILIIYNFSDLVRLLNIAYEGCVSYEKINAKTLNKINDILYLSKFFSEEICCSVICIDKNGVPRDLKTFMELDVMPLFTECHDILNRK